MEMKTSSQHSLSQSVYWTNYTSSSLSNLKYTQQAVLVLSQCIEHFEFKQSFGDSPKPKYVYIVGFFIKKLTNQDNKFHLLCIHGIFFLLVK